MTNDQIVLVDYDLTWPEKFEAEVERIFGASGNLLVALEHVGSTSVPGLAAKPVIDMLGGVRSLADADALVPRIVAIDYEYVTKHEDELPRRRYFVRRDANHVRTHHLHVVEIGSWFWTQQLAFRDHLRTKPDVAARYGALKRELAARFLDDREAYTAAKSDFIAACIPGARVQGR